MVQAVLDNYEEGKIIMMGSFRPWLECPDFFENETFKGTPKFEMIIYEMMFEK